MSAVLGTASDARAVGGDAGVALRGLNCAVSAQRLSPLDAHEHRQRVRLAVRVFERPPSAQASAYPTFPLPHAISTRVRRAAFGCRCVEETPAGRGSLDIPLERTHTSASESEEQNGRTNES